MNLLHAIILGVIQGLTEFLPISSSGHLAIAELLMKQEPSLSLKVSLHVGTLVAILVVFWRQFLELITGFIGTVRALATGQLLDSFRNDDSVKMFLLVLIALVPTGILGLLVKHYLVSAMSDLGFVGAALLINGGVLFATRWSDPSPAVARKPGILDALLIGIGQGLATIYGISRSGSTISAGLFRRLGASFAVSFSFLVAIPAIAGAELLEIVSQSATGSVKFYTAFLGAVVSGVVGYLFLRLLIRLVRRGQLSFFAYYSWLAGIVVIIFHFLG
jgi:undecaprenyl-diphosphatase